MFKQTQNYLYSVLKCLPRKSLSFCLFHLPESQSSFPLYLHLQIHINLGFVAAVDLAVAAADDVAVEVAPLR